MDIVKIENGGAVTNSKIVADKFGVKGGHRYILKVIREIMEKQPEFGEQNYLPTTYTSSQNKVLPCFTMTRSGFTVLAMGLTGDFALDWKIKFDGAFCAIERELIGDGSFMAKLESALGDLKESAEIASGFGRGLAAWRQEKPKLIERVDYFYSKAQLTLGFK